MKVVCGMKGGHADISHWADDNVFCGSGVPGDEPVPKQRRQRLRAKLNGLENAG